jgi:phage terminase small subunit
MEESAVLSPKLTEKQKAFVEEYLVDLNATQAAIRAGYSQKTARKIGNENLTKPDIQQAIAEAKKERSERTKVNADWLLKRLADEAEADLADLYKD